ncbi:phospholipid:diacylglycerol acyltransferase [Exophiala dermatitidis]|uniref:Phospholipid:diacylglycerol acyltransferase n=2 Tax=Exophiala dermatitidis TaxID=5970 RepID=H6BU12_EXODN|nr:phospholipid:diacylglycerol acyltransferase [Exophiala dermatitidis NIH/UT8656]KAJ4506671.1 phospholipid:diacylglycerol acyltransferase [Exophiala dermatitidis]EHY55589.1 phospholipid:diacylglycerol acyltransferase [Exophiala dermatitidis NIH/UT8656]KAJ4508947.1 phospholipid:diacylglycerol acyltransferase [Exophiala dermatitidis]KAJ4510199.1 phospholipid:diacylglycerol acyltransferase [Exophiala dermatitidis]KAJ4539207.1 phospholipid:diacylglycerol acyltransferase [Exophiala dermatitidis]
MSALRRRIGHVLDDSPSPSPSRDSTPDSNDEVKVVSKKKLEKLKKGNSSKRRSGLIFGLGGLLGLLLALLFAQSQDVIRLEGLLEVNLDSLMDVIPAGIVKDVKDLSKAEREAVNYDSFAVGLALQAQGITAHHPVIMVPGVISTGLESWSTGEKSRQYFRKRLWGSWSMMRALVLDQALWKTHIMLDKETGLDPPGIKLRAAQGFDATDFFITGYWIWNKILENLATIGYDPTNAFTAAYDWRLSYANLEYRDQYFTRLKNYIEVAHQTSGRKAVLVSHSMGSQVLFYFMKWVEHKNHGNGGPRWVNDHIDSWINISGCMLGTAKDIPAVLSGEMKDTAQLNAFAVYGLEKFLSKEDRAELFRAMPGISSMLPKGGEAVWGNSTWAPDDLPSSQQNSSFGVFISFRPENNSTKTPRKNLTMTESFEYLMNTTEPWYHRQIEGSYSHGVAHTKAEVEKNEDRPQTWLNPLEARLPIAPDMKIFCFYGIGKPTERAYFYKDNENPLQGNVNITIDTSINSPNKQLQDVGAVDHGVIMGEGDGTVNLLSTGYMCAKGWKKIKRYNPANIKITTYEMPHEPDRFNPRGGPNTGDHVDILGRSSLNDLILRVAGGRGDEIEENYKSRIWEISDRVQISEKG